MYIGDHCSYVVMPTFLLAPLHCVSRKRTFLRYFIHLIYTTYAETTAFSDFIAVVLYNFVDGIGHNLCNER